MQTDMEFFNEYLPSIQAGRPLTLMFIAPTSPAREALRLEVLNQLHDKGLSVIVSKSRSKLIIENSAVYLKIAHPHLHEEFRGMRLDAIHGFDYLSDFPNSAEIAVALASRIQ